MADNKTEGTKTETNKTEGTKTETTASNTSIIGQSASLEGVSLDAKPELPTSMLSSDLVNGIAAGDSSTISSITLEDIKKATENGAGSFLATEPGANPATATKEVISNTKEVPTYSINDIYSSGQGRLLKFKYNNSGDDNNKRAYFKIGGQTQALKETITSTSVTYTQLLAIFNQLTTKYQAFILLNLQENLQERQMVMPTVGDTFAATFSGADPQILSINGLLPFDNSSDRSWFIHFMNMYVRFIRASVLSKYKCWLELVVPDYQSYRCYPISITCALDANSDNLVQFGMSCVVANDWSEKAYGYTAATYNVLLNDRATADANAALQKATAVTPSTNTEENANKDKDKDTTNKANQDASKTEENKTKKDGEAGNDKSSAEVGTATKKKNILGSVNSYIKKVSGAVADTMSAPTGITVNGKKQSLGEVIGATSTLASTMLSGGKTKGRSTNIVGLIGNAATNAGKNTSANSYIAKNTTKKG